MTLQRDVCDTICNAVEDAQNPFVVVPEVFDKSLSLIVKHAK